MMLNGGLKLLNSIIDKIPVDSVSLDKAKAYLKGGYNGSSITNEDSVIYNPTLSIAKFTYPTVRVNNADVNMATYALQPNIGETPINVVSGNLWSIFPTTYTAHISSVGVASRRGLAALSATVPTDFMRILFADLLNAQNFATRLLQYFNQSASFFAYLESLGFWSNTKWKVMSPGQSLDLPNYPVDNLPSISLEDAFN